MAQTGGFRSRAEAPHRRLGWPKDGWFDEFPWKGPLKPKSAQARSSSREGRGAEGGLSITAAPLTFAMWELRASS